MSYQLQVYGYLNNGSTASYIYSLDKPVMTEAEVIREANDFANVVDWRLAKITETVMATVRGRKRMTATIRDEVTLRGFKHGMTVERFFQLMSQD